MVDRTAINLSVMKRLKRKKRAPARMNVERHHVDALSDENVDLSVVLETNGALIARLGLNPGPNDLIRVNATTYPSVARSQAIALNGLLNAVAEAEGRMHAPVPDFIKAAREAMVGATSWEHQAREFVDGVTQWYP